MSRAQLLECGFSAWSIGHRIKSGRLHPIRRGIYAVGRRELSREGRWMAAVLACGPGGCLSHLSAAALWEIGVRERGRIDVSVAAGVVRSIPGVAVHRRASLGADDVTMHRGIPVATPACTLIDLAALLPTGPLERAIGEADKRELIDPEALRDALERSPRRPGRAILRRTLDRRTFVLTDSELERRFLRLARRTGLSLPETGRRLNGFKVDFFWPHLGLVVETDGLRYHRTAAQQARDGLRDQAHTAAGLTCLRFTHAQIRYESDYVGATLDAVAGRLRAQGDAVRLRARRDGGLRSAWRAGR